MTRPARAQLSASGECLVVTVPLRIARRGGRKEVIAPTGLEAAGAAQPRTNRPLALALARAHRWRRLLEEGRYATVGELAQGVGMDNSYVARQLRLTLLAPDLIESVLEGTEPDGLSLGKLYGAPMQWEAQRRLFRSDPSERLHRTGERDETQV
jgi:hypothetical protein